MAREKLVTASEWLLKEVTRATHSDVVKFGAILAALYKQETGQPPKITNRKGKSGKYTNRSYGYPEYYLPMFDTAYDIFRSGEIGAPSQSTSFSHHHLS